MEIKEPRSNADMYGNLLHEKRNDILYQWRKYRLINNGVGQLGR